MADSVNNRIRAFDSKGAYQFIWGSAGSGKGEFAFPYGIIVDPSGYIYVTESKNNRVQKFGSKGSFITVWGRY